MADTRNTMRDRTEVAMRVAVDLPGLGASRMATTDCRHAHRLLTTQEMDGTTLPSTTIRIENGRLETAEELDRTLIPTYLATVQVDGTIDHRGKIGRLERIDYPEKIDHRETIVGDGMIEMTVDMIGIAGRETTMTAAGRVRPVAAVALLVGTGTETHTADSIADSVTTNRVAGDMKAMPILIFPVIFGLRVLLRYRRQKGKTTEIFVL